MRFKATFLEEISSEMLHSFQINSLHIMNSDDLPVGQTLCTSSHVRRTQEMEPKRVFQPFASFIIT